jgi:murein tripeptide amidase MpaA
VGKVDAMNKRTLIGILALTTILLSCKPAEWFGGGREVAPPAEILPPVAKWSGPSEKLLAEKKDPWITPAEVSGFETTPSYEETMAWLRKLAATTPTIGIVSIGKSATGRDIWMVVACEGATGDASTLKARGKPTVLAQAGIHSGEIDGKDAGMMLLRDIVEKRNGAGDILSSVNLLFVPIFNVDGHELVTSYSRINQRGPSNAGWRATSQRLNLNRDYVKADTPEMRAMLAALAEWQPDLYVDLHVTDGADFQYDITFGSGQEWMWSPSIARWIGATLTPAIYADLETQGHKPGPMFFPVEDGNWAAGVRTWSGPPRFSDSYGSARHIPTLLVENHSLKPFRRRVLGTRVLLESILRTVGANADSLKKAIDADRNARPDNVPLSFKQADGTAPRTISIDVIEAARIPSEITGSTVVTYTGKPLTLEVPMIETPEAAVRVTRPKAYWIPPTKPEVVERLAAHGVKYETIRVPTTIDVDMYRLVDPGFAKPGPWEPNPFEGRARISASVEVERRRETFPAGSIRVSTDQPSGTIAVLMLEPQSPDSLFQWGFFLESLQRVEYFEEYAVEPLARRMLYESPDLKKEFEAKLAADAAFRDDPNARLRWFYERSRYYDDRWKLYPVARER